MFRHSFILFVMLTGFCHTPSGAQHFLVNEQVQNELDNGMFLGAVVTAGTSDGILFNRGYGERDTGLPMNTETMFDLASITKVAATSTALAILMTDSSHMSIHDRAARYLDGLTGEGGDEMTIAHLGTHTSGLDGNKLNGILGEELIEQMLARDISWPVNTKYFYSGNGTIRLSELVAQQSGMSFGEFCMQRIYQPMGMTRTMFGNLPEEYRDNVIKTTRKGYGNITDQIGWRATGRVADNTRPVGNAGLFSTGSDLSRLATLWLQKGEYEETRYFSEEIYDIFSQRQSEYGTKGILWNVGRRPSGMSNKTLYHSGHVGHAIWIDPKNDWYVIVLTIWDHEEITVSNSVNWDARERIAETVIEHFTYLEDSARYADTTFTLDITTRDLESDTLLPGTAIDFDGTTYTTGANGTVSIPGISFGYYSLTADRDNYFPESEQRFKIFSDTSLTFTLQADLPDVAFTVTDYASGEPVYRALVTMGGKSSPSGSDGTGEISDINPGTYEYTVEHDEYFTDTGSLVLRNDTSFAIPLTARWADVQVQVLHDDDPVQGATVELGDTESGTGSQGMAMFYNRDARVQYPLRISHTDYEPFSDTILIETDTTVTIAMTEKKINNLDPGSVKATIYPNPVREILSIDLHAQQQESFISICSPDGRVLFENSYRKSAFRIDTTPLQPGPYYLVIHSEDATETYRFMVAR